MASLTSALTTANTALAFNQNAISVTSNNVANANTVGYTRQVITSENQVLNGVGQGVTSGTVTRYADQILQTNMDKQNATLSYNKTITEYFETIESQFGSLSNDSTNLDSQISDMFTQMNNLIQDPTLSSNRVTFMNSTTQTASRLNSLSNDLATTQVQIDDQITTDIEAINVALKNISDLNSQIAQVERADGNSSDLKDLRQKEIATVSEYLPVTASEKEDGVLYLTLNSGKVLVDSTYVELSRSSGTPYGGIGMSRVLAEGTLSNTTQVLDSDDLEAGSFGAMVDLRDKEIPELIAQLDNFAVQFAEEFNNIHAQGSAVPPPTTLTTVQHAGGGASLLIDDLGLTAGTDFDISVVDSSGNPVATTAGLAYTGDVSGSTIANITTGTFDPEAYLAANGSTATIEGTASVEYLGGGAYRMTDPSGSLYTATLNPNTYPVDALTPAQLDFGNGVVMTVDAASAEPLAGNIGTIDLGLTSGSVRIEAGDTLDDLAAKINANTALNGSITAAVVNGTLQLTSNSSANGVVLGNDPTGNTFNRLGFNRYFEGDSAASLAVSSSITSDINNIATGRMRDDGGFTSTNNENAVAMANLQNTQFSFAAAGGLNAQESTLSNYFISITSSFAAEVSANSQQQEFNQTLYDDFYARVQSESGVNTDEEFANLIVYQRSYEAAARMISTVDEMLETLINMV